MEEIRSPVKRWERTGGRAPGEFFLPSVITIQSEDIWSTVNSTHTQFSAESVVPLL